MNLNFLLHFLVYLSLFILLFFVLSCLNISDSSYDFFFLFVGAKYSFIILRMSKFLEKEGSCKLIFSVFNDFFTVLFTVPKMGFFHQINWKLPQLPSTKYKNVPVSAPILFTSLLIL